MKQNTGRKFAKCLRGAAIGIVASAAVAAPAAYAKPGNTLVLVSPTQLPAIVRQGGDAMFLHQTVDGRTLLYVEQDKGAVLAVLDVTDPGHVKAEASVQLGASGAFDFVSALGPQAELVRFRQGQQDAILDLHKERVPALNTVQGPALQGQIMPLGGDGFSVSTAVAADAQPAHDYQVIGSANAQPLFDVKQVHQEISDQDTGATFLLADTGLYLIRRPAVEMALQFRENNNAN